MNKTCDRCGLPGQLLDLDLGSVCHAEPGECIAALKEEIRRRQDYVEQLRGHLNWLRWSEEGVIEAKKELERLRGAVAYLRENIRPPAPDHPAWCWSDVWKEFERRVDGK